MRLPRSCVECARRKVKCDQESPCGACCRRGQPGRCMPQTRQTRPSSYPPRGHGLAVLQHRLAVLEARLGESAPDETPSPTLLETQEHFLTALESLSFGESFSHRQSFNLDVVDRLYERPKPAFLLLVPDRGTSDLIINWALANLTWIHCGVRPRVFQGQHWTFWEAVEGGDETMFKDHGWLSVYFSLLAVGLLYMEPSERPSLRRLRALQDCLHHIDGSEQISRLWYETAIRELEASGTLLHPALPTVQATAILTLCHGHFGQSQREYVLLGLAINTARALDMHLLASEDRLSRRVATHPLWSTSADRHMGRRLWWTLVICDWLGHFSRVSSIPASSFNTTLEAEAGGLEDLVPQTTTSGGASPIWHHLTLSRLARIVYTHIKGPRDPIENRLALALDQIDIIDEMIPRQSPGENEPRESWMAFQEYLVAHTVQLLRVTIARAALVLWVMDRIRTTPIVYQGVDAALQILEMGQKQVPALFQTHWILPAATLSSGIFLAVHLVCFKAEMTEFDTAKHRRLIQNCIDRLRTFSPQTGLVVDGAQQIERLAMIEQANGAVVTTDKAIMVRILEGIIAKHDLSLPSSISAMAGNSGPQDMDPSTLGWLWPDTLGEFRDVLSPLSFGCDTLGVDFSLDTGGNPTHDPWDLGQ